MTLSPLSSTGFDLAFRSTWSCGMWAGDAGVSFSPAGIPTTLRQKDRRGPSLATHRQNSKAQWCLNRMDRRSDSVPILPRAGSAMSADASPESRDGDGGVTGRADEDVGDTESRARAFQEGALAVDELLARGAAAARSDESLRSREEMQRLLVQEEARRRKEVEMRRARRREREARDPHKKVALKLENRRRYGQSDGADLEPDVAAEVGPLRSSASRSGTLRTRSQASSVNESDGIPMAMLDVAGCNGNFEQVAVVDVRSLRAKCQGLSQGGGASGPSAVRSLLDQQRRREKLTMSSSTPSLPFSWQERVQTR